MMIRNLNWRYNMVRSLNIKKVRRFLFRALAVIALILCTGASSSPLFAEQTAEGQTVFQVTEIADCPGQQEVE